MRLGRQDRQTPGKPGDVVDEGPCRTFARG